MKKIACAVKRYLNRTETFIYTQIRNLSAFQAVVLTGELRNLGEFPHEKIFSLSSLSPISQLLEKIMSPFGGSGYFRKIIREEGVSLIHAHFSWEGISMLPLKRRVGLPMITSFYGRDVYLFNKDLVFRWRLKDLFKGGDLFLTFSDRMRTHVIGLGCPQEKIRTHHGGVDPGKFDLKLRKILPGENINILIVGRLVEKKGIEYGIKAFSMISGRYPAAMLNIIGDGPLEGELNALISALGLTGRVRLFGAKSHSDYIVELKRAHIMLSPSVAARSGDEEGGINTTVIEALATGLPVIATEHSGSELVFDGRTGYIVKERDEKDLAAKMGLLLSSPGKMIVFGEAGRKLIEDDFDIVKQTKKLEAIYKELIDKYGSRP